MSVTGNNKEETDMEKIVLFGVDDARAVQRIADHMRIKVQKVSAAEYHLTLEQILAGQGTGVAESTQDMAEISQKLGSLLLFCEVTDKHIDKILFELRSQKIAIAYKAVLTPTNQKWTVKRLFANMALEKRRL